jgi:gamma-glutamylcyclotransferase
MIHYFAYGSNMLEQRLHKRCKSANLRGVASATDWLLTFSKRSRDDSGKATIHKVTGNWLFGVVYDLDESDLPKLDRFEGVGNGYDRANDFLVHMEGSDELLRTVTYMADLTHTDRTLRPYDWYLDLVLAGARQHSLPAEYVNELDATQAVLDPWCDRPERLAALALLKEMAGC